MHYVLTGAPRGQKALDAMETGVTGNCEPPNVGSGDPALVLSEGGEHTSLLSRLSSPAFKLLGLDPNRFHCICMYVSSCKNSNDGYTEQQRL